jgi:voltage-gated potassium channel Kch
MKYTRHSAVLAAITSAQVSEFGFILIFTGAKLGYLHGSELEVLTIVALSTIIVSSYLITYNEKIYQVLLPLLKKFGRQDYPEETTRQDYQVWVFGYHRIGWKVCEALAEKKIDFAVVDYSPEIIAKLKRRGIPAFFGDAADVEFLDSLPLEKAQMIISTIPEPDDQKTLFDHVRRLSKETLLIGNLHYYLYLEDLYEVGANYVMMPHLVTGEWLANIVRNTKLTENTFKKMRAEQKEEMKLRFTAGTHE